MLTSSILSFSKVTNLSNISCGECLNKMKEIPDNSIDLIITDPPYNLGLFMKKRGTNIKGMRDNHFAFSGWDDLLFEEWVSNMDSFIKECNRVLKKRGTLLIFMSLMKVETIINLALKHNFYYKTVGIWHKTNPMPRNMNLHFLNSTESWLYFINKGATGTFNNKGKAIHDFIETSTINKSEKRLGKHPTQKPLELISHFVEILSNEGDVVLDPFMGSGTTGVACEKLNRIFYGVELDSSYYDIAKKRLIYNK